jgi:hypothetical protein
VALDDNAIQSQKYTSIGRFQLFLKVFVALACARIGAQLAARRSAFNRLGLTRTLATCVQAQLADVYGTNSYGLSVRSRLGPIVCPFTLAARRKVPESTIRYDHHLPSWPGDDWHSVALAPELISSSATAMDEPALATRASLAAWSARRAPSSRISLSAARPLRLVLFFGVVPACMADIVHSSATLATESGRRLHDVFRLEHDQHDAFV